VLGKTRNFGARPRISSLTLAAILFALLLMLAGLAVSQPASAASGVINVRDLGARGDGVTDDTAALQSAINQAAAAGGSVYLPSGTYMVRQQGSNAWALRLSSNVTVYGDGPSSLIKLAANQDSWTRVVSGGSVSNVILRDFGVDGNDNNQATWSEQRHGVFLSASQNITCRDLYVTNTSGDGIFYYSQTSGLIENNTVVGGAVLKNARVGINFQGGTGVVVQNNSVQNYDTSYKAEIDSGSPDASSIQVLNNYASGGRPLALNGSSSGGKCRNILVEGNTLLGTAGDWTIWVGHSADVTIRNNVLSGGYSGVYSIFDNHNLTIEGNDFRDQVVGVQLSNYQSSGASDGIHVLSNTFRSSSPVVNVSAGYSNVEVALNGYSSRSTLIAGSSQVSGLSVHDNAVGTAPATTTTQAPTTTTPPSSPSPVYFSSPIDNSVVSNWVNVSLQTMSTVAVNKVRLSVDDRLLGTDYRSPYTFTWNTQFAAPGIHTLTGIAYDQSGRTIGQATISVTVGGGLGEADIFSLASLVPVAAFADMAVASPYDGAILSLAEAGVVSGFDDGTFGAVRTTTRAQVAKMVSGVLGIADSDSTITPFTDLGPMDAELYPQKYIAALLSIGSIEGTGPGRFSPYDSVTRAQLVTMVMRALRTLNPGAIADPPAGFAPAMGSFSSTHDESMRVAEYNGLLAGLQGYGAAWDPWAPATRGEVAQMLRNVAQLD
jgi:hypothetical protein